MLFGRTGDLHGHLTDTSDGLGDGAERLTSDTGLVDREMRLLLTPVHHADRLPGPLLEFGDHLIDLFGGLLGPAGQGAYLIGHHRKATTLFASSGRFDGGIECQQIGLICDAADHIQYLADCCTVVFQFGDHSGGMFHFARHQLNLFYGAVHAAFPLRHFLIDFT